MTIIEKKENNLDPLIENTKAACERIKEINTYIDRLKNRIKVHQDDPQFAYYDYICNELEEEKHRIANNLREAFKEIIKYNEELQGNYRLLQKSFEIQQIMNRYCARALKEESPNINWLKKRHTRTKIEEELQKIKKEEENIVIKMQQTTPIVDTIKPLLSEIDKKQSASL